MILKGAVLGIETGEYEDKAVYWYAIALRDFDMNECIHRFKETDEYIIKDKNGWLSDFGSDARLIEWMAKENLIQLLNEPPITFWNIGDYGRLD